MPGQPNRWRRTHCVIYSDATISHYIRHFMYGLRLEALLRCILTRRAGTKVGNGEQPVHSSREGQSREWSQARDRRHEGSTRFGLAEG
jgi:hypothetical protein